MDSPSSKPAAIAHDISPYLIEYSDGTIERQGTERASPGFDLETGVTSKDIIIIPETGVSARIYRPKTTTSQKLPLVLYLHGGAFTIASPAFPFYHNFCNTLVGSTKVVLVSVDYRRAPEHPLPAAFEDTWVAIQWVAAHATGGGPEPWLTDGTVDYNRVFLAGDSAGATLAHHTACRVSGSDLDKQVGFEGIALIHPYFWGKDPVGLEGSDPRREMVDRWWLYVCPSDKGCDDPLINPFADGTPGFDRVVGDKMLVMVAENDVLREREGGSTLMQCQRGERMGRWSFMRQKGKIMCFISLILAVNCDEAVELRRKLASFINQARD